jgi:hypothetical protein
VKSAQRVGGLRRGGVCDGGLVPAAQPQPGEPGLAHDPCDALVVDQEPSLAQLGGDTPDAVSALRVSVDSPYPRRQPIVIGGRRLEPARS